MKNELTKTYSADLLFRIGLSSFFIINSLAAWFAPDEFIELLGMNTLASSIASPQFWVYVIGINDAALAILILLGIWRRKIVIWATVWIIAVIYVTISEGLGEFIEHAGLLFFMAYYYLTPAKNLE